MVVAQSQPISRSGRFDKGPSSEVQAYTESISFDWKLWKHDIRGSIAHATMLAKVGILTQGEASQIIRGLESIGSEIERGKFQWKVELEDVHMNIEAALTSRVAAAAKLHTARSRNDQVATDIRLWLKDEIRSIQGLIKKLQKSLVSLGEKYKTLPIPGYTHLQRAQPVLVPHVLLAYVEMLQRDLTRLEDCRDRMDVCPLGSGAIAGTSLPIDRKLTAKLLGFREVSPNSMDAISDRDFLAEFLFAVSLCGVHLSRLSEDLIIWSSAEFGFIRISDSHTTGSSLMPHKKNPDVAELCRGKSGKMIGNLMGLLVLLKGLPMTYNRDLQEDKPFLFESAETLSTSLSVVAGMMDATAFIPEACERAISDVHLLATELADFLVKQGVPFRLAHHAVGAAVAYAEKNQTSLGKLSRDEWSSIHPKLAEAARELSLEKFFKRRESLVGAPSVRQVTSQLSSWKKKLSRR